MRTSHVLMFGTFIGPQSSLGYEPNQYYGLQVWLSPSKIPRFDGAIHIFIKKDKDETSSSECEYESIEALSRNWRALDMPYKTKLDFGIALVAMQVGKRVARVGWNGSGMWLSYGAGRTIPADGFWNPHTKKFAQLNGGKAHVGSYINLKSAQNTIEMGRKPTSLDMFAQDWQILD